jgi:hypothetical protein
MRGVAFMGEFPAMVIALELSQRYDSKRVGDVLAQVAQEFRETRVWPNVPILMKKQASDQLREMLR